MEEVSSEKIKSTHAMPVKMKLNCECDLRLSWVLAITLPKVISPLHPRESTISCKFDVHVIKLYLYGSFSDSFKAYTEICPAIKTGLEQRPQIVEVLQFRMSTLVLTFPNSHDRFCSLVRK
ncbi:hypothetical protein KSS87_015567 [Heliosperma pusillum]|nr:hypothetical protein KSS87_015567 [Heliosperma pusillum]